MRRRVVARRRRTMSLPILTLGTVRGLVVAAALLAVSGAGFARGAATRDIQAATVRGDTSFAGTVARLSEAPGYFDSDNLISNETSYLHAVSHLRSGRVSGGAYVGVGPDQSFSYIAAIRPSVAFMIDIRRDNLLMHLMFKALFERSSNRLEFLSRWTGRVVPADVRPWDGVPIERILAKVDSLAVDSIGSESDSLVATVRRYGVPLTLGDTATVRRFHGEFIRFGLDLRFTSTGRTPRYYYPTLRDLILERDLDGRQSSYLASEESWRVVKDLEGRDRVIPVVGNLAGSTAFPAISREITARRETVAALYVSNVEMYIWRDGSFPTFAANAARLPRTERSVIIRSFFGGGFAGQTHPLRREPHVSTQLVQTLDDFARREKEGWPSYWDLVTLGNR
jgi:hypothetical protein